MFIPGASWGTVLQTVPQALSKVFSESGKIEKRNAYLTKDQIQAINANLEYKTDEKSTLVTYYVYFEKNQISAYAYIDVGIVRKETETLMIVVGKDGSIRDIEVLQFSEPKDYIPPGLWKKQFQGKSASELKNSKTAIVGITGATLTSKAVTKSVQKVLAIHQFIHP